MALSQSAVDDWKQGNLNSIETASSMDLRQSIKIDTLLMRINFKYAAGLLYKNDKKNNYETTLPTDNILAAEGVLTYPINWKIDPYFSASFNTQLTESFIIVQGDKQTTARLWDPVTSLQSWGFEYSVNDTSGQLLSRIGFSLKQIRAYHYTRMTDDFTTKDIKERYKTESGIQWKSEFRRQITETLNYRGTLDLFGTFDDMSKWTIGFQNEFKITVWQLIAILIKADIYYDENQSLKTQYNQSIRFGIVIDAK